MSKAMDDVLAERRRQIEAEGWTAEHDDTHVNGEMAKAAACYALGWIPAMTDSTFRLQPTTHTLWPWALGWWKPKGRRRDLVRAGALIIAEIERRDRAAERTGTERESVVGSVVAPGGGQENDGGSGA